MIVQARDSLGVLLTEGVTEAFPSLLGLKAAFGQTDLMQHLLGFGLQRIRQLIQHVGRLVHPAQLRMRLGIYLSQRGPEPQRAVSNSQSGTPAQSAVFQVSEKDLGGGCRNTRNGCCPKRAYC